MVGVRKKLSEVYRALRMDKPSLVVKVCYGQMMKQFLSRDLSECVLFGCRMVYHRVITGLNVEEPEKNAQELSLQRYIVG